MGVLYGELVSVITLKTGFRHSPLEISSQDGCLQSDAAGVSVSVQSESVLEVVIGNFPVCCQSTSAVSFGLPVYAYPPNSSFSLCSRESVIAVISVLVSSDLRARKLQKKRTISGQLSVPW